MAGFLGDGSHAGVSNAAGDDLGIRGEVVVAVDGESVHGDALVHADADGGNLPVIAETLRNQNPDRVIVIAADDDPLKVEKVGHNPGLEAAKRAAERSNAQILKPSLTADEQLQGLTDHNDVHVARGFDVFRREIRQQLSDLGISTSRSRSMQISPKKQKSQSNQMSV